MKRILLFTALAACVFTAEARVEPDRTKHSLSFIENKGQIKDQNGTARNDIQFVLPTQGMNIFLGDGQLHYQFTRIEMTNDHQPGTYIKPELRRCQDEDRYLEPFGANIHTYRLDVELVGATITKPIAGKKQLYYETYYLPGCPKEGLRAYSYDKVTYKNVYPDIDWVIFVNGNKLEHEFVVGSKGDASRIRLKYKGQTSLRINSEGSVVVTTPMGTITEEAPVCYGADGTHKASGYKLNGDVLTYDLKGNKEPILIDPELIWGTYYGPNNSTSPLYDVKVFDSASMYSCGLTWADNTIATTGSHQAVLAGQTDAFLIKFDTGGIRQWATYMGGPEGDYATSVDCDTTGKVYMCGLAGGDAGMVTPGAQQTVYGGGSSDGFLAKFAPDGSRIWSTLAGGAGSNFGWAVSCDLLGKVYITGETNEANDIATPGAYQTAPAGGFDWYVIQYDTDGVRQWGTYFGGSSNEWAGTSCSDGYMLYLTGWTNSAGKATAGAHQTVYGGNADLMLVKFYTNGALGWASYYGGSGAETAGGVACDRFRNIYLYGQTDSDAGISTPGSYQPARSGFFLDAFLVKFNPEVGARVWGTYYGGTENENVDKSRISCDDSANIYIMGRTESPTGIVMSDDTVWQNTFSGGPNDGFLVKFNHIGERKWGTYIGGDGDDDVRGVSCLGQAVFICGQTASHDSVATPGSFLETGGSTSFSYQGFLEKFSDPDTSKIPEEPQKVIGVSATNNVHLMLYPNPNHGTFTMEGTIGDKTGIGVFTLTDVAGRTILHEKTAVHNGEVHEQVQLGSVPPGVYWLRYQSPEGYEKVVTFRKE